MKYADLKELHTSLLILAADPLPVGHLLAKNIVRVKAAVKETDETLQELLKAHAELDDAGNVRYGDDRRAIFTDDEHRAAFHAASAELQRDDTYKVDFHRIAESRFDNVAVRGDALAVLIEHGVVIPDDELDKAVEKKTGKKSKKTQEPEPAHA